MTKLTAIPAILSFILMGCISVAKQASDMPKDGYAKLALVGTSDYPGESFGINGVRDPNQFKARKIIYIAKGRRTVWYGCPGFVYTDSGPSITYRFKDGERYELVCTGPRAIINHLGNDA